jgi:hypothetical protein
MKNGGVRAPKTGNFETTLRASQQRTTRAPMRETERVWQTRQDAQAPAQSSLWVLHLGRLGWTLVAGAASSTCDR